MLFPLDLELAPSLLYSSHPIITLNVPLIDLQLSINTLHRRIYIANELKVIGHKSVKTIQLRDVHDEIIYFI